MAEMKRIAIVLIKAIERSLHLDSAGDAKIFSLEDEKSPTELFRIFNYPPHNLSSEFADSIGVGKHLTTDS